MRKLSITITGNTASGKSTVAQLLSMVLSGDSNSVKVLDDDYGIKFDDNMTLIELVDLINDRLTSTEIEIITKPLITTCID